MEAYFGPSIFDWSVLAVRIGGALLLAGLIGLDRTRSDHAAGLKTHMLVSSASAAFAIAAIEMTAHPNFSADNVRLDLTRIVEAVTAGVAFLAAGTIFRAGDRVRNLTTGAGLWAAGAIGLSCGLGFWRLAVVLTGAVLLVLLIISRVERLVSNAEPESTGRVDPAD